MVMAFVSYFLRREVSDVSNLKAFDVDVRAYKTIRVDACDEHEARRLVEDPVNAEWVRDEKYGLTHTWDVTSVKQIGKSSSKHKGIVFGK